MLSSPAWLIRSTLFGSDRNNNLTRDSIRPNTEPAGYIF